MTNRALQVICDCGGSYTVLRTASRERQRLILDYAICPHCLIPRFPRLWLDGVTDRKCVDCGIPFKVSPHEACGRCNTCYISAYRLTKRIEVVTVEVHGGDFPDREGD